MRKKIASKLCAKKPRLVEISKGFILLHYRLRQRQAKLITSHSMHRSFRNRSETPLDCCHGCRATTNLRWKKFQWNLLNLMILSNKIDIPFLQPSLLFLPPACNSSICLLCERSHLLSSPYSDPISLKS